jgi:UDP-N-acetyl-D-mannosaminuronate dehydrogenase
LSARINEEMPYFSVNKTIEALSNAGVCPNKAKVLLLGMAFKKDISDLRHSPAIRFYQIIRSKVRQVNYHDPHVKSFVENGMKIRSIALTTQAMKRYDAIVILTDHSAYDYKQIIKHARLIIDTRNAIKARHSKVKKLGYSKPLKSR